jgi:hypothetical protein
MKNNFENPSSEAILTKEEMALVREEVDVLSANVAGKDWDAVLDDLRLLNTNSAAQLEEPALDKLREALVKISAVYSEIPPGSPDNYQLRKDVMEYTEQLKRRLASLPVSAD